MTSMSNPEGRVAALSPAHIQLLQQRLKEKGLRIQGDDEIPRRAGGEDCLLSFAQERLWFLAQLEPDNPCYNIPLALRLQGNLDIAAFTAALNAMLARHEALRTSFILAGDRPLQHIQPSLSITPSIINLKDHTEVERQALVREWFHRETRAPFELRQAPLLRLRLLQLGAQEHIALFTLHHIIADGWSLEVLAREISALYTAARAGQAARLAPLPVQYPDYALWQRRWLTDEVLQKQLSYWQQRLHDAPLHLPLPTDRPRPGRPGHHGNRQAQRLPAALSQGLRQLSRREGATLFMTLLAVFQVLLARCTCQNDVVVGTPVAGRTRTELEGLIGFFVNTLALRVDLANSPTFRQLLRWVREAVLGAFAHQDAPFEKVVQALRPERQTTRQSLFNVLFTLQNGSASTPQPDGLTVSVLDMDGLAAKFDLELLMVEETEGLTSSIAYDADLFDNATVIRWQNHLQTLFEAIVVDPDQRITDLPLLTHAERRQLLVEWNDTSTVYPMQCLHRLFEAQVACTPDATAVISGTERLTYRELNRRADHLARRLRSLGVSPEMRIGVCMERSAELVVALLAALKSGGAYVPLDLRYPKERLAFMLKDADMRFLVTQKRIAGRLPSHGTRLILVDDEWKDEEEPAEETSRVKPENLAYVIYTSGSTGVPKGVAIEHRSAAALLNWARRLFDADQLAGTLASTSICFDLSVFELFAPLCNGGKVILAQNVLELPALPAANEVSLVNTVPSAMSELLRLTSLPTSVQVVNLAGESLSASLVNKLYEQPSVQRVFNLYGPTEATTYATASLMGRDSTAPPPIGRPIDGYQVYMLDRHLQPAPVGIIGELYIGGEGLGRGYLHRSDLTADRFIPNPFKSEAGARLYRTGDLARWLPDGNIEFLGRFDHQVKLRGFRLELGEIEAALNQHPDVRACVAAVWPDESGGKRLVAYMAATHESKPTIEELHRFLRERLPDYVLPAAFVWLEELPLLASGKPDRKALPATTAIAPAPEMELTPPRTLIEELLIGIWGQVLGLKHLGVQQNFFHLGGHSLLATQIISRAQEVFRVELPLRFLFEAPTVASFGRRVEEALRLKHQAPTGPLERVARDADLPLSYAQQRLWFIDRLEPDSPLYNIPTALRLRGRLDIAIFEQALNEVVRRHEVLRATFAMVNGQPAQRIAAWQPIALPTVDLGFLPETDRESSVQRMAEAEVSQPFSLEQGPLLRVKLLRLRKNDHVALLTIHHIVSDGWSMNILIHELAVLYEAFSRRMPSPLPELSIQYADFAIQQRRWLQGELLDRLLDYWRRQLGGDLPALNLPLDRPRPPVQSHRGATLPMSLSRELSAGLSELSRREGVTLFMTLLAAFQTLLHRLTGQYDIVVGSDIANRNRPGTEALLGFFVNQLALRTDLSGDPTFRQLLGRVREVALGAYGRQDLPFDLLVQALQPERDLSYSPLFQVKLILNNMPAAKFDLPGLTIEPLTVASEMAHFDLVLSLTETSDGLAGWWQFNTDLFNETTVIRLRRSFQTLLESIVAAPDERLSNLRLLTEAETGGRVLSDFPDAQFSQKDFENLILEISDVV